MTSWPLDAQQARLIKRVRDFFPNDFNLWETPLEIKEFSSKGGKLKIWAEIRMQNPGVCVCVRGGVCCKVCVFVCVDRV